MTETDVPIFLAQLRDLLVAGLSLIEALEVLRRGARSPIQATVTVLIVRLRAGHPFSAALASDARFPGVLLALVRSAEVTSDLPQALTRYLDHERRARELRHRIVSLSIYPLLVMAVGAGVFVFLAQVGAGQIPGGCTVKKTFSFRTFACMFAVSMLGACASFAEGVSVSELLSMQEKHVDQEVSVDGVVGFHDGYCIVDLHDKNKFMPMAIPVRLFGQVKALLGTEVVVDGLLQAHKLEERADSFEFSPTQLLISKVRSKSDGK